MGRTRMNEGRLPALAFVVSLVMLFTSAPASAGDLAHLEPIGFSEDGSVFAYQESGIQDGSGFAYANLFVLDLEEDRFIDPSPFRILIREEGAQVGDAMAQARAEAAAVLEEHVPNPRPGQVVVEHLPTDLSSDDKLARFVLRAIRPPIDDPVELRLEIFPMAAPDACLGIAETYGYRLTKIALRDGDTTKVLHEDTGIPVSRRCPLDYGIRQVRITTKPSGGYAGVAIIAIESVGFEGPDVRHIALPVPID